MKRPTLILEGVDCGGKTTLAHEIQKRWSCKYIHVKQAPKGIDTLVHFITALKGIRQPTIIDRLHWSEQVYAEILRGNSLLSDRDFGVIDGYVMAHKAIFILCSPMWNTIRNNILKNESGENHNMITAGRVYQAYKKNPRTVIPIIEYDYEHDTVDKLLKRAQACMEGFYG